MLFGGNTRDGGNIVQKVQFLTAKQSINLVPTPDASKILFNMMVIDEAHHIFSDGSDLKDSIVREYILAPEGKSSHGTTSKVRCCS